MCEKKYTKMEIWNDFDLDKLNEMIMQRRNIMTKKELADCVGLTQNGLHSAILKGTLRFKTFQKICRLMEITPCEVFQCEGGNIIKELEQRDKEGGSEEKMYVNLSRKYVGELEEEVKYLREANKLLMDWFQTSTKGNKMMANGQ